MTGILPACTGTIRTGIRIRTGVNSDQTLMPPYIGTAGQPDTSGKLKLEFDLE